MLDLCISTYVYGWYENFIPLYIYSILHSYPSYHIKIFCYDQLNSQNKQNLAAIKSTLPGSFEVVPNYRLKIDNADKKHFRWLLPHAEFAAFKCVYIGDVDILIMRENPGILEGHLAHCNRMKLPYSNIIRDTITDRMTGLHFIRTEAYYQKMAAVIEEYTPIIGRFASNENLLYTMVKKGIGLPPPHADLYRPHHGFHLGIIRDNAAIVEPWKNYVAEATLLTTTDLYRHLRQNAGGTVGDILTKFHRYMGLL